MGLAAVQGLHMPGLAQHVLALWVSERAAPELPARNT